VLKLLRVDANAVQHVTEEINASLGGCGCRSD
jgi:hypothetical protein